jgi:hypothetical protein
MEQSRHLEPAGSLRAYRHVRSSKPHWGAASRIRNRLGLRQQSSAGTFVRSNPLPAIQCLASELCARRGFDIKTHGNLPAGGTILSVDDLNFDRALVLLNLFENARVYSDRAFDASTEEVRSLSLRVQPHILSASVLESVVSDLGHERVVAMSRRHCDEIRKTRAHIAPMRRVRVELSHEGIVQVFVEV